MNARRATLATTGAGAFVIALTMAWQHAPLFVWNASESVPVGLYAVRPSSVLTIDELVLVQPSETLADFLAAGGYLPKGLPLLKHIAALPGSKVCRSGLAVTVDGVPPRHCPRTRSRGSHAADLDGMPIACQG